MTELTTIGEQLVERKPERDPARRFHDEPGRPGQHRARRLDKFGAEDYAVAALSYVNPVGHAVLMIVVRVDDRWEPVGFANSAGHYAVCGPRPLPQDCELSDEMRAALDALDT